MQRTPLPISLNPHPRITVLLSLCEIRDDAHSLDSGGVITNLADAVDVTISELDEWGGNVRKWIATHIREELVRSACSRVQPHAAIGDALGVVVIRVVGARVCPAAAQLEAEHQGAVEP